MILLIVFAFLAGLVTILSPCILSIAPILLTSNTEQSRYKPLGIISGLVISFSFFTLSLTAIVHTTGISPDIFRYIALGIIILFGLTMIIPAFENIFTLLTTRIAHIGSVIEEHAIKIKAEFISGLILGAALGLIWTPCAGPILATITAIAATGGVSITTILMALAYSTGAAIPMLLLCFGGTKILHSSTALVPYSHTIRQIFGVITIATAFAIIFHVDTAIQEQIAHLFPNITIENNALLHKELHMLKEPDSEDNHLAPELVGITDWLNSPPLTLAKLRGKVVLIDFWTYTCINCIRSLPHVKQWYDTYKNKGLVIIGVHTPEFAFEKNKSHVEDAIKRFNITYPVALDNDYKTWRAYDNHYWPAHYLINQNGIIVKTHFGEGDYVEMENAICALLKLPRCTKTEELPSHKRLTSETYLGFERGDHYQPSLQIKKDTFATYQSTQPLGDDQVGLTGDWTVTADHIHSEKNGSEIILNFVANHVYLVMQSDKPQEVTILLNDKPIPYEYQTRDISENGNIIVHEPRMYELVDLKQNYGRHTLTLQCPKGINAYVFTFG